MTEIPRTDSTDSTLAFLREGYPFVTNRCRALGTDVFRARLMFSPITCAQGPEAAEVFYTPGRFTRRRALPFTAVKLLQDYGSIQVLDGAAHAHRKRMFLDLLGDAGIARLVVLAGEEWRRAAAGWPPGERIALLEAAELVLCRAALRWSGLSPEAEDAATRAREYGAMIRGAGDRGAVAWTRGALLRVRNERWARRVIEGVREGRLSPGPDGAARVIALHRDPDGRLLTVEVAAVELLNILRPVTAVALFVIHAGLALHRHPEWRDRLAASDDDVRSFVQEVRRLAPFFPAIGGRVAQPFEWRGHRFAQGEWMLLDLWGTNRDPRAWEEPEAFRPERFAAWDESPFSLIPQGGGPYEQGHRCPGERATIALMEQAARFLSRELDYDVADQDLSLDLSRMPALPPDGFLIEPRGLRPA